jgi:hypothetical protein
MDNEQAELMREEIRLLREIARDQARIACALERIAHEAPPRTYQAPTGFAVARPA